MVEEVSRLSRCNWCGSSCDDADGVVDDGYVYCSLTCAAESDNFCHEAVRDIAKAFIKHLRFSVVSMRLVRRNEVTGDEKQVIDV